MSRLLRKLAQISTGNPSLKAVRTRRAIGMLAKHGSAIARAADDGDFERYVTKDTTTMDRDYSAERDRDVRSGLDIAWGSNEGFETGSDTPPVSGKNDILERVPQEQKYAALLKWALQSGNSVEEGYSSRIGQGEEHAELTDAQQAQEVSEAFDAVPFYAPHSPEGGSAGEIFQRDGKEKAGQDMAPDLTFLENEEARGLPQWPRVLNDSRQAGQGDEPTGRAWSEHDSFSVTNLPSVDSQGNPGPST